jgi:hypothetical protein
LNPLGSTLGKRYSQKYVSRRRRLGFVPSLLYIRVHQRRFLEALPRMKDTTSPSLVDRLPLAFGLRREAVHFGKRPVVVIYRA